MADQETKAPEAVAATTSATEPTVAATPEAPSPPAAEASAPAEAAPEKPTEKPAVPAEPTAEKADEPATTPAPAPAAAEAAPATQAPAAAEVPKAAQEKPADKTEAPAAEPAAAPAPEASKDAEPKTAEIVVPVTAAPAATTAAPDAEAVKDTEATKTTPPAETKEAETKPKAPAASSALKDLWATAQAHAHSEIWGVTLADPETHVPSQIILQKYLNANDGDLAKAKDQLTKTLDWRAKTKPLELVQKKYNKEKFGGLGYITSYTADAGAEAKGANAQEVFTWNIYGGVKSMEETFGKLEEFIDWRVALMELAVHELSISTATERITAEQDPYKIYQVHDYKSISFLRQAPAVKTASKETITVLAANYPELLKEKFFINVPAVMGFMYAVMKLFVAPKTLKKFHPMSNGAALAKEFGASELPGLGEKLPKEYGGKGPELAAVGKQTPLEE
ncbi:phosphatidylinositol transfer protein SFH5 [Magnaporthiopsis poae ATCC 64411]|uniref:Phosphatidylinositol transfer protein SFH5 n=1 Tax=Magnaporthiopsis poae (strain ATCC 64411 / 73-15) TaxID=644358 RepID=A0A0C4E1J2_MAGP6|nr:phosphatidylinositol transfer protein SFH5 [Magnaporthiopsis poae ATCC 64411]